MKKLLKILLLIMLFPLIASAAIIMGGNTNTSVPYPIVTTNAATSITGSTATLNGTAYNYNSTGTSYFNYGTTSAYGSQTSQVAFTANTLTTAFSANISGLTVNITYHFQACVSNGAGPACGSDLTFIPVGLVRLAAYPTGITNPTAMVLNSTKDYLYVAASGAEARGMVLDAAGGLFVTALGGSNLYVAKIRVSDFVITNAVTIAATNTLYRLLASDLSINAASLSGGLGSANSLWTGGGHVGGGNQSISGQLSYIPLPIDANFTTLVNLGANNQLHAGVLDSTITFYYAVEYIVGNLIKTTGLVYVTQISLGDAQSDCNSSAIDATDIYVGGQYKLSKINQASFALTAQTAFAELSPTTTNPPTRVCLSSANYVYCARESFTGPSTYNPSWVTMFRKSDMVEQPALILQAGESRFIAGAIDNTNNLMYLLSYNNGSIVKLSITP